VGAPALQRRGDGAGLVTGQRTLLTFEWRPLTRSPRRVGMVTCSVCHRRVMNGGDELRHWWTRGLTPFNTFACGDCAREGGLPTRPISVTSLDTDVSGRAAEDTDGSVSRPGVAPMTEPTRPRHNLADRARTVSKVAQTRRSR
jgi:hypothetical protein